LTDQQACKFLHALRSAILPSCGIKLQRHLYPEEEICRSRSQGNLSWIQAQRRLIKANAEGYFTMEMLGRDCILKSGIRGLDPDREEKPQLQEWMKKHPRKREVTDEDRTRRTDHLKKHRFSGWQQAGFDHVLKTGFHGV
jgi:hypothetical protein